MTGIGGHQQPRGATDDWFTPPAVIDALGGARSFDLDPCTMIARPWDTARAHYTPEDDGLAKEWFGRVWLNPPYNRDQIGAWLWRMARHGRGVALIFARTETEVFHRTVWEQAEALLFLEGRLHFHAAADTLIERRGREPILIPAGGRMPANAGAPSVLVAYGRDDAEVLADGPLPGAFVALRLRTIIFGASNEEAKNNATWIAVVGAEIERAGGTVTVADLYRALADHPKAGRTNHLREKIRQTLQRGPFAPVARGVWEREGDHHEQPS